MRRVSSWCVISLGMAACLLWTARTPTQEKKADPLHGKTFQSLKKLERGLTPDGVALGYWSISFKAGGFTWSHSDVSESGKYVFDAETGKLSGTPAAGKLKYQGSYDAKTGILTWEKQEYKEKK